MRVRAISNAPVLQPLSEIAGGAGALAPVDDGGRPQHLHGAHPGPGARDPGRSSRLSVVHVLVILKSGIIWSII